jgi:hypothetical protein
MRQLFSILGLSIGESLMIVDRSSSIQVIRQARPELTCIEPAESHYDDRTALRRRRQPLDARVAPIGGDEGSTSLTPTGFSRGQ